MTSTSILIPFYTRPHDECVQLRIQTLMEWHVPLRSKLVHRPEVVGRKEDQESSSICAAQSLSLKKIIPCAPSQRPPP